MVTATSWIPPGFVKPAHSGGARGNGLIGRVAVWRLAQVGDPPGPPGRWEAPRLWSHSNPSSNASLGTPREEVMPCLSRDLPSSAVLYSYPPGFTICDTSVGSG